MGWGGGINHPMRTPISRITAAVQQVMDLWLEMLSEFVEAHQLCQDCQGAEPGNLTVRQVKVVAKSGDTRVLYPGRLDLAHITQDVLVVHDDP